MKIGSIVGAVAALAITFSLIYKSRAMLAHPSETVTVLPTLDRPDGEISFAEK